MSATRPRTAAQYRSDAILGAVIGVGVVLSSVLSTLAETVVFDTPAPQWYAVVYAVVLGAALTQRRRWPCTVAVIVCGAYFVAMELRTPEMLVGNIAMFIAIYTVGAWCTDRRRANIVRAAITVMMLAWLLIAAYNGALDYSEEYEATPGMAAPYVAWAILQVLINLMYFGGAWYFGNRAYATWQNRSELEERTAELERERELTSAQAVALDRARIARELHDVVAHHVSLMGVQAGAGRMLLETDPSAARASFEQIEDAGRSALTELRALLTTLRASDAEAEPEGTTIGIDGIPALVAAASDAGMPAQYTVVGTPTAVPQLVQTSLYRIAQEALTNARRHGGARATADVRLRYLADAVELEVANAGRAVRDIRPGLGTIGMRERAEAVGGTLLVEPRASGGLLIRANLPLTTGGGS